MPELATPKNSISSIPQFQVVRPDIDLNLVPQRPINTAALARAQALGSIGSSINDAVGEYMKGKQLALQRAQFGLQQQQAQSDIAYKQAQTNFLLGGGENGRAFNLLNTSDLGSSPAAQPTASTDSDSGDGIASTGSVFGLVPDGKGGMMNDPQDSVDAAKGIAGFNPNKGAWGANIKDPNLAGVAVPESVLDDAGIDRTASNADASGALKSHVAQVTLPDGTQKTFPIVDTGTQQGRVDFTLPAYRQVGGPEVKGGGTVPGLKVALVPRATQASNDAVPDDSTFNPDVNTDDTGTSIDIGGGQALNVPPAAMTAALQGVPSTPATIDQAPFKFNVNPDADAQQLNIAPSLSNVNVSPPQSAPVSNPGIEGYMNGKPVMPAQAIASPVNAALGVQPGQLGGAGMPFSPNVSQTAQPDLSTVPFDPTKPVLPPVQQQSYVASRDANGNPTSKFISAGPQGGEIYTPAGHTKFDAPKPLTGFQTFAALKANADAQGLIPVDPKIDPATGTWTAAKYTQAAKLTPSESQAVQAANSIGANIQINDGSSHDQIMGKVNDFNATHGTLTPAQAPYYEKLTAKMAGDKQLQAGLLAKHALDNVNTIAGQIAQTGTINTPQAKALLEGFNGVSNNAKTLGPRMMKMLEQGSTLSQNLQKGINNLQSLIGGGQDQNVMAPDQVKQIIGLTRQLSDAHQQQLGDVLDSYRSDAKMMSLPPYAVDNAMNHYSALTQPDSPAASAPATQLPLGTQKVSSQAEFDALPKGAVFTDDSGKVKRKK